MPGRGALPFSAGRVVGGLEAQTGGWRRRVPCTPSAPSALLAHVSLRYSPRGQTISPDGHPMTPHFLPTPSAPQHLTGCLEGFMAAEPCSAWAPCPSSMLRGDPRRAGGPRAPAPCCRVTHGELASPPAALFTHAGCLQAAPGRVATPTPSRPLAPAARLPGPRGSPPTSPLVLAKAPHPARTAWEAARVTTWFPSPDGSVGVLSRSHVATQTSVRRCQRTPWRPTDSPASKLSVSHPCPCLASHPCPRKVPGP